MTATSISEGHARISLGTLFIQQDSSKRPFIRLSKLFEKEQRVYKLQIEDSMETVPLETSLPWRQSTVVTKTLHESRKDIRLKQVITSLDILVWSRLQINTDYSMDNYVRDDTKLKCQDSLRNVCNNIKISLDY